MQRNRLGAFLMFAAAAMQIAVGLTLIAVETLGHEIPTLFGFAITAPSWLTLVAGVYCIVTGQNPKS